MTAVRRIPAAAVLADESVAQDRGKADRLLDFFLLEKVFYEIEYEMSYRPDWVRVPVRGALRILMRQEALALGFRHVEAGPLVRSSYHAKRHTASAVSQAAAEPPVLDSPPACA